LSWKCDFCDSYNDEKLLQCFVCEQERSIESIREAKKREREVKLAHINDLFVKTTSYISRNLVSLASLIFFIAIIGELVINNFSVNLDDIGNNLEVTLLHAGLSISNLYNKNLAKLLSHVTSTPAGYTGVDVLKTVVTIRLQNCYYGSIPTITNKVLFHISALSMVISSLVTVIKYRH